MMNKRLIWCTVVSILVILLALPTLILLFDEHPPSAPLPADLSLVEDLAAANNQLAALNGKMEQCGSVDLSSLEKRFDAVGHQMAVLEYMSNRIAVVEEEMDHIIRHHHQTMSRLQAISKLRNEP